MTNQELFTSISNTLDYKFDEISKKSLVIEETLIKLENDSSITHTLLHKLLTRVNVLEKRVDALEKYVYNEFFNVYNEFSNVHDELSKIHLILENEIRPNIKLLAENYLPAATRYESALQEHTSLKDNVQIMTTIVTGHSTQLENLPCITEEANNCIYNI